MKDGVTIKINPQSFQKLERFTDRVTSKLKNKVIAEALALMAKPMVATAKELVPVRTGTLRKSINYNVKKGTTNQTKALVGINTRTTGVWLGKRIYPRKYAVPVEFKNTPYMRPAYHKNRAKSIKIFKDHIRAKFPSVVKTSRPPKHSA